jgi:Uma2 family endonuclease
MAEPVFHTWSVAEFFAWQALQKDRYELVDGQPLKMMAGAKNVHDDIVVNLIIALGNQLRGRPCRPFTGDGSLETRPGQIRRPDVGVDRGPRDPNSTLAAEPKLLIEVLSPSTRDFDSFRKLEEYKGVASVDHVLLVEPNEPLVAFWSRDATRQWTETRADSLEQTIEIADLAITLSLCAVYESVEFPAMPRHVGITKA